MCCEMVSRHHVRLRRADPSVRQHPGSSRCRAAEQLCGLPEPEEDDDEEREVVTFEHSEEGDKAEARPC